MDFSWFQKLKNLFNSKQISTSFKEVETLITTYEVVSKSQISFTFEGNSNTESYNTSLESAHAMRQKIREHRSK